MQFVCLFCLFRKESVDPKHYKAVKVSASKWEDNIFELSFMTDVSVKVEMGNVAK